MVYIGELEYIGVVIGYIGPVVPMGYEVMGDIMFVAAGAGDAVVGASCAGTCRGLVLDGMFAAGKLADGAGGLTEGT